MGYTNKDRRIVNVTRAEKRRVTKLRRLAEHRELHGERICKLAIRATRRGWWYA
jgi:hypothetical protein